MSYGKTFDSLYTGSMVGAGLHVFGVWNYVIANSKPPGVVELNPRLMAAIFGCEVSLVVEAIRILCEPDPESRSKECDGRRLIHEGQFLYSIPTWSKYNQLRNEEERRAQNREHARAYRKRKSMAASGSESDASGTVRENQDVLSTSTATSSEGEPERDGKPSRPDDVPEDLWQDWLDYRKAKRAPVTQRVLDSTRRTATAAGMTMEQALNHWIANGQTGFYPRLVHAAKPSMRVTGAVVDGRRVEHPRGAPVPNDSIVDPCYCGACIAARERKGTVTARTQGEAAAIGPDGDRRTGGKLEPSVAKENP